MQGKNFTEGGNTTFYGTGCETCFEGKTPSEDFKTCVACPAGKTSTEGVCADCEIGKVSAYGDTSCTQCDVENGEYSSSKGASSCKICPSGTEATFREIEVILVDGVEVVFAEASSTCETCGLGFTSVGGRACGECPIGKYSFGTYEIDVGDGVSFDTRTCTNCDPNAGEYQNKTGQYKCRHCETGTVSVSSNQSNLVFDMCVVCDGGKVEVDNVCVDCSAGKSKDNSDYDSNANWFQQQVNNEW